MDRGLRGIILLIYFLPVCGTYQIVLLRCEEYIQDFFQIWPRPLSYVNTNQTCMRCGLGPTPPHKKSKMPRTQRQSDALESVWWQSVIWIKFDIFGCLHAVYFQKKSPAKRVYLKLPLLWRRNNITEVPSHFIIRPCPLNSGEKAIGQNTNTGLCHKFVLFHLVSYIYSIS